MSDDDNEIGPEVLARLKAASSLAHLRPLQLARIRRMAEAGHSARAYRLTQRCLQYAMLREIEDLPDP